MHNERVTVAFVHKFSVSTYEMLSIVRSEPINRIHKFLLATILPRMIVSPASLVSAQRDVTSFTSKTCSGVQLVSLPRPFFIFPIFFF